MLVYTYLLHANRSIVRQGGIMQRLKRLAQGTLSKQKLAALQRIFDAATTQKWFDNSEYSQEGFAVVLIGLSAFGLAGSKLGSDSHLLLLRMMLLLVHRRISYAATISTGEPRSVRFCS